LKDYIKHKILEENLGVSKELERFLIVNFRFLPVQRQDILNLDEVEHEYGKNVKQIILDYYE